MTHAPTPDRFGLAPDAAAETTAGNDTVPSSTDCRANDHLAAIFDCRADQFAAVVPFLRAGLERGERCLYVADAMPETDLLAALEDGGIDVERARASGALTIRSAGETYLRSGAFDPDEMLAFWTDVLAEARDARGFAGVRAAAEMSWACDVGTSRQDLAKYESVFNDRYAGDDYVVLCQYDRERFSQAVLADVIRTHPFIVYNGTPCRNFYYHPPEEFAAAESTPLDVDRMLDGLVATTRAEQANHRRERELAQAQERLEEFATAVSHDLREPLRTVASYLDLLERRYGDDLDEEAADFIDFAVDGATRMREMIDGLVATYAREDADASREPVDLDAVLDEVQEDLSCKIADQDAEIRRDTLPTVAGDPAQLHELLLNFVDNAIKYAGDEPPRIEVFAERAGDRWQVAVRDNGIGIPPEAADRIFTVFTRLEPGGDSSGTGVGLALCERIVERHGGDIWVDSTPGDGSTFWCTLPACESDG